jgi:hypothetical protein
MKTLFIIVVLLFAGIGYYSYHKAVPSDNAKLVPQFNPNPKYFMAVEGNISKKIIDKAKLNFRITYITNNIKCSTVINKFEGVTRPRQKLLTINIKTNKQGYYKSKIPIDALYSGYCEWVPASFSYKINKNEYWPVAIFSKTKTAAQSKVNNIQICQYDRKSFLKCSDSTFPYFSNDAKIYMNQNYTYQLTLRYEDNR